MDDDNPVIVLEIRATKYSDHNASPLALPVTQHPIEVEGRGYGISAKHRPKHHADKHVIAGKDFHPQDPPEQCILCIDSSYLVDQPGASHGCPESKDNKY